MKKVILLIIIFINSFFCYGQTLETVALKEKLFQELKDKKQKITLALDIIEEYTYLSQTDKAQQWTYELVSLNYENPNDTIDYYIRTNQAEIFYWCNLFEFAEHSANEALKIAKKLNDSMFISNAAMFVSYVKEMQDSLMKSIQFAHYANLYFPKIIKKEYRIMIDKSQIINNLAQVYVKLKVVDSAIHYNKLAYPMALAEKSERAIIYCDYNYANIYLQKNMLDSSMHFFNKSNESALQFRKYDLLLQNYTMMLDLFPNNKFQQDKIISQCFRIIDTNEIAPLNKVFFYKKAIDFFRMNKNEASLANLQEKYIKLQDDISQQGNKEVQKISKRFVENENHILQIKIQDLNQRRKSTYIQVLSLFSIMLFSAIAYYYYARKRKIELESKIEQQRVISHERYRIANDIHDDLGSNLSRIRYITNALPEIETKEELQLKYYKIISLSDDSVDKMNEIIWSLKNEEFTIEELVAYIRKMSHEVSEEKNIEVKFLIDDDINQFVINAEVCRNLYLTVKEALHNAIKHAKASVVEITATYKEKLIFKVKDNGIGFNDNRKQGNGLQNMKQRMKSINGYLHIDTSNEGTIVNIHSNLL